MTENALGCYLCIVSTKQYPVLTRKYLILRCARETFLLMSLQGLCCFSFLLLFLIHCGSCGLQELNMQNYMSKLLKLFMCILCTPPSGQADSFLGCTFNAMVWTMTWSHCCDYRSSPPTEDIIKGKFRYMCISLFGVRMSCVSSVCTPMLNHLPV